MSDDIQASETEGSSKKQLRRKARRIALQVLYEIDCAGHSAENVLASRLEAEDLNSQGENFVKNTVTGVLEHRSHLDSIIHDHAPEWPVDQMSIIDRNILRMSIFELAIQHRVHVKIIINEAVELAKMFGSDSAPRFINGVLGTIANIPTMPDSETTDKPSAGNSNDNKPAP